MKRTMFKFQINKLSFLMVFAFALLPRDVRAEVDSELLDLQREVKALEGLRLHKLDSLEKIEATRWNARYGQQADLKLLEDRSRQFEGQYSRLAGDLSRKQEEVLTTRQFADERESRLQEARSKFLCFQLVLKQELESEAAEIGADFPVGLTQRVVLYNDLQTEMENENPAVGDVLNRYFKDQTGRIALTQNGELQTRSSVFEDGVERTVWSLRLGTLFLAEVDKMQDVAQVLFHTGSLQGRKYAWKNDLTKDYVEQLKTMITGAQSNAESVPVLMDLLQNGKIGVGILKAEEKSFSQRAKEWFNKGGLVMYPLVLTALLALFFAAERLFKYLNRGAKVDKAQKELLPLVAQGDFNGALDWCNLNPMGLSKGVKVLLENRHLQREDAEQLVRQVLLQEIPNLEKRLSLISALGAAAPLMGLLGTVSGMITLFKVITDVGTNDARILAGGISEALITTQTGLIIAIPILLIHGFLSERLEVVISKINESILEVLNRVWRAE